MCNEELIELIRSGTDTKEIMEELFLQVRSLLKTLIYSSRSRFADYPVALKEELYSESCLAFCEAVRLYDPASGYKFSTYLVKVAMSRCYRFINSSGIVRIPEHCKLHLIAYKRLKNRLAISGEELPTDEEIRAKMGISEAVLEGIKQAERLEHIHSLSEPLFNDDGESIDIEDCIPDGSDHIEEAVQNEAQNQLNSELYSSIERSTQQEKDIIKAYYFDNLTGPELAKRMNVSRQALSQKKQSILKKLNTPLLRSMYFDIYGYAIRGVSFSNFRNSWTSATESAVLKKLNLEDQDIKRMRKSGMKNSEIARRLGCSVRTIQRRLKAISLQDQEK